MGYISSLNRNLNEYLYNNYSEDEDIQALLDSYYEEETPEQYLFEAVDREILYEFIEAQGMYYKISKEVLEEIVAASEDCISYFLGDSINEVYEYYDEIGIKMVLLQTDLYKYNEIYCLVWEGF